jgi:CRP-like cAMP-binding protein
MTNGGLTEGNLLLTALPEEDLVMLEAQIERLPIRTVLLEAGDQPRHLVFPMSRGVVSIVRTTSTGQMVEAGVVGDEGLLNIHHMLTTATPGASRAIVQNDGVFAKVPIARARALFDRNPSFRSAVLAYTSVFLDQVTQNVVCNGLHALEQRLAKWLLLMYDRTGSKALHITQEFLSYMLGVHRPGVSITVTALTSEGLIDHRRNWIELTNLEGIESRSCECYRPLRTRLQDFRATGQ